MRNEIRANLYFLFICGLIATVLFLPTIPIMVAPAGRTEVVDTKSKRAPGVLIKRTAQHYTFESADNFIIVQSDASGFAVFPDREVRISPAWYITANVWTYIASINPHASSGPHAYFVADKYKSSSHGNKKDGKVPARIVVELDQPFIKGKPKP